MTLEFTREELCHVITALSMPNCDTCRELAARVDKELAKEELDNSSEREDGTGRQGENKETT